MRSPRAGECLRWTSCKWPILFGVGYGHVLNVWDRLGPLSIEPKKRTVAKRAKLEKNKEDMKKPQEITEDDITRSENETTKNVATVSAHAACAMAPVCEAFHTQLERLLAKMDAVNLFKFIINPNDFGQSVENLFYLSFLIRDGKCALEIEEGTGEPKISESTALSLICRPLMCPSALRATNTGGL